MSNAAQNSQRRARRARISLFLAPNWAAMMMGPFAQGIASPRGADPPSVEPDPGRADADESDVRKAVEELKQEVDALRKELRRKVEKSCSLPLERGVLR